MQEIEKIIDSQDISTEDKFKQLISVVDMKATVDISLVLGNTILDICKTECDSSVIDEVYQAIIDFNNGLIDFDELTVKRNALMYLIQDLLDDGVRCPAIRAISAMVQAIWIYNKTIDYKGYEVFDNDTATKSEDNIYTPEQAFEAFKYTSNVFIENLFRTVNKLDDTTHIDKINLLLNNDVKKLTNGNV